MSVPLSAAPQGKFTPVPAGTHVATCYRLVDLGTQKNTYKPQDEPKRRIMLSWEIADEFMSDGRPMTINQGYSFFMSKGALLRKHLEAWRGKAFTDQELKPGGFDLTNVVGASCTLTITESEGQNGTRSTISGIGKLIKGITPPNLVNEKLIFSMFTDTDWGAFNLLSDKIKDTIKLSPEYVQLTKPVSAQTANQNYDGNIEPGPENFDDEIPF